MPAVWCAAQLVGGPDLGHWNNGLSSVSHIPDRYRCSGTPRRRGHRSWRRRGHRSWRPGPALSFVAPQRYPPAGPRSSFLLREPFLLSGALPTAAWRLSGCEHRALTAEVRRCRSAASDAGTQPLHRTSRKKEREHNGAKYPRSLRSRTRGTFAAWSECFASLCCANDLQTLSLIVALARPETGSVERGAPVQRKLLGDSARVRHRSAARYRAAGACSCVWVLGPPSVGLEAVPYRTVRPWHPLPA